MEHAYSLNIEYFFLLLYNAATGVQYEQLPGTLSGILGLLQGFGVFFSLLFLAGLVYFHLRHEHLHHEHEHTAMGHGHAAYEGHVHGEEHDLGPALHGSEQEQRIGHARWQHVMSLMTEPHQSAWRQAIVEADILLSELLTDLRLPGDSIGEQLKQVNRTQFTTLDLAWEAHRVRNDIAHRGSTFDLSEREARRTIDLYRQVFDEFGYV